MTTERASAPIAGRWVVNDSVRVRREDWGAVVYDQSSRRLATVRSLDLAMLLDGGTAFDIPAHPVGQDGLGSALLRLEQSGFVRHLGGTGLAESRAAGHMSSGGLSDASIEELSRGLRAPICITWELTYACNLNCLHCLSSSGRRDPRELTTAECESVVDELRAMGVFYVNVGGGEPTVRPDFWHLLDYAVSHDVGVKFSTNGIRIDQRRANALAAMDYVDIQVSLDGATAEVNDQLRGHGSYDAAIKALRNLAEAGFHKPKISVVMTRDNIPQLDAFKALADEVGGILRLTRLRPAGRGADVWADMRPTAAQQRELYAWLVGHGEGVMTGDSFFHLSALGQPLPGMNLCGAGRVVCLVDPIGDVYACPFAMHERFLGGNVREAGFAAVWQNSSLFSELRGLGQPKGCSSCPAYSSCRGGCMAAKFFTGGDFDDPDPECVFGNGTDYGTRPERLGDHSRALPLTVRRRAAARACETTPLGTSEVQTL